MKLERERGREGVRDARAWRLCWNLKCRFNLPSRVQYTQLRMFVYNAIIVHVAMHSCMVFVKN